MNTDNKTLVIRVDGDLLSTNASTVRKEINGLLDAKEPQAWDALRLDLSKAEMIDSVGLGLVAILVKEAKARGAKLQVAYSSPNVLRTLVFTRLSGIVEAIKV